MSKGFKVVFEERQDIGEVTLEAEADEEGQAPEEYRLEVQAGVTAKFDKQEHVLMMDFWYCAGEEADDFLTLKGGSDLSFYHGSHSAMMRHIIGGADHWYGLVSEGLKAYETDRRQRARMREYAAARGR